MYQASGLNEWDEVRNGRTMNSTDSSMPCPKSGSSKFEVHGLGSGVRGIGGQGNIIWPSIIIKLLPLGERQRLLSTGYTFTCRSKNNAPLGIMYHTLPTQCSRLPSKEPPPDKCYNEQSQPSKRAILWMVSHGFSQRSDECADLPA